MEFNGYKCKTTFWQDFTIADAFGVPAIEDTFNRAFDGWKSDVIYLTELVMVLNWKLWYHYENGNNEYAEVYDRLFRAADQYAVEHLNGDDLQYFYETTD